ncbi:MAG: hypothetical protein PHX83_14465 [Acidobacteriia bacterium]|nr:hypothetical protein [Terriglobia bacterium]
MMNAPQSFGPAQPSANQLHGIVPPRGAGTTTADLGPGFDARWLVMARVSWERVVLMRLTIDGTEIPVLPQQDGDLLCYPLPLWTPEQLATPRRMVMTWSNRGNHGAQFTYQLSVEKPIPPAPVMMAQQTATVLGPPIGQTTPMQMPGQMSPGRTFNGPMSPPAFPLSASPVPMLGMQQVAPPVPAAPMAPHMTPAYAMPPAVGQVPTIAQPTAPVGVPMAAAPALPLPMAQPPQDPATELESYVAGSLGVTYLDIRNQAQSYGARYGFPPDAILQKYVDNFGSSGLELVPRDWIQAADKMAAETGMNRTALIASTVLHSLVGRMTEDRDFAQLRASGAVSAAISAGQAGASGPDFVVHSTTSEPVPETQRGSNAPPRVTGAQLKALAVDLHVEPSWLFVVVKTLSEARNLSPDLVVPQATPMAMRLLRGVYLEDATKDVDQKLGEAENVSALVEALPELDGDAAFVPPPTEEEKAANRSKLIEQAVVTRSLDHICRDLAGQLTAPAPAVEPTTAVES